MFENLLINIYVNESSAGQSGDDGETGAFGPLGPTGYQGPVGRQGPRGFRGEDIVRYLSLKIDGR